MGTQRAMASWACGDFWSNSLPCSTDSNPHELVPDVLPQGALPTGTDNCGGIAGFLPDLSQW